MTNFFEWLGFATIATFFIWIAYDQFKNGGE